MMNSNPILPMNTMQGGNIAGQNGGHHSSMGMHDMHKASS